MTFHKITTFIRGSVLEDVENALQQMNVRGLSVSKVKGYGEYTNFFAKKMLTSHVKIEIFTVEDKINNIVDTIMQIAHTGLEGDGIVAIQPVEKIFRIRTRSEAESTQF